MEPARARERSIAVRLIEARTRKPFEEQVRQRREKGQSYRQIGKALGVSGQTIWRHYRNHEHAAAITR